MTQAGFSEERPGAAAMRVARVAMAVLIVALPVSIALTEAALITGLVALLVARRGGRRWRSPRTLLWPASLALVGSWVLASCTSPEPAASLFHARKLYALGLIALAAETLAEPALRRRLTPLLMVGAVIIALTGFLIYAVQVQRDPGYRLQSLLSNQMTSAGVLAACALWGVGALTSGSRRSRVLHALALLPVLMALALTQTRSHWLGFACGAMVLLLARAPRWWWTLAVGGVGFALAAPAALTARLASILDPHEPGNQGRLSMWRSGMEIWRERFWTGAGVQDLLSLYRQYKRADATFESGHFHNNLVQFAVSSGVLGLAAFVAWSVAGFHQLVVGLRCARPDDRGLAASALAVFVAMQVAGQFDFTFGDAEVVYQSYLALGLALALASPTPDEAGSGA